jgi:hypothetical protein
VSSDFLPPEPEVPEEQIGEADLELRYEDVCQDGRLRLAGVWAPMGRILWSKMRVAHALQRLRGQGVRNVLSFIAIHAEDEPVTVRARALSRVRFQLGHTLDARGEPNRIIFNTWLRTEAPRGKRGDPSAEPSGERVLVAKAFGQHVLTRPRAARGEHRVLTLEDPELPAVPEQHMPWRDADGLLVLPEGAQPLDPEPRAEEAAFVFGLVHTDGNQHVNFLIYPRLAEDAALRRLSEHGIDARLLGRRAEVGYKRPCFAGDRMRVVTQAFRLGDELGAIAALVADSGDLPRGAAGWAEFGRLHCVTRMVLSR